MSRKMSPTYSGARGRVTVEQGAKLGADYVCQPKHDGYYAELQTDSDGYVNGVYTRTGRTVRTELLGTATGMPNSRLAGELMVGTERANQVTAQLGYQTCHIFDCIACDGIVLDAHPYRWRRDLVLKCAANEWSTPAHGRHWYYDSGHRRHDLDSGDFCRDKPTGWRRLPIVEQWPAKLALRLWDEQVATGLVEGLVFCRLSGLLGTRRSKIKCKPSETMDVTVIEQGAKQARVAWACGQFVVGTGAISYLPGMVLEVKYEGFYAGGTPRFPRVVRKRIDLTRHNAPCGTMEPCVLRLVK